MKEFRTFKQYIQEMDIKEDTKKKYLRSLENMNDITPTVLNHYANYIIGYITPRQNLTQTILKENKEKFMSIQYEYEIYQKNKEIEELRREIEELRKRGK